MKIKSILILILLLLLPSLVLAKGDSEYIFSKEKVSVDSMASQNNYASYKDVVASTEENIYVKNNRTLYKLDKNFNEQKKVTSSFDSHYLLNDEKIVSLFQQTEHEYYLKNYDLDLKETLNIKVNMSVNNGVIKNFVTLNNNYYILYESNNGTTIKYNIMVLDKTGTVKSDKQIIPSEGETYKGLYPIKSDILLVSNSKDLKTTFIYSVTDNSIVSLVKKLENIQVLNLKEDNDNVISMVNDYGTSTANKGIKIFDNSWNITKNISLVDTIEGESSISDIIGINDKHYLFFDLLYKQNSKGTSTYFPTVYIFDKNLNYLGKSEYENENFKSGVSYSNVLVNNESIYIAGGYNIASSNSAGGNFVIEFIKASEKDFKIKTEVLSGEGKVELSKEIAKKGEEITFEAIPNNGYELKQIKVYTESGMEIITKENKLTVTNENIIIKVEFKKSANITDVVNPNTIGSVSIIVVVSLILSAILSIILYYKVRII